jgi:hypothetical protein
MAQPHHDPFFFNQMNDIKMKREDERNISGLGSEIFRFSAGFFFWSIERKRCEGLGVDKGARRRENLLGFLMWIPFQISILWT